MIRQFRRFRDDRIDLASRDDIDLFADAGKAFVDIVDLEAQPVDPRSLRLDPIEEGSSVVNMTGIAFGWMGSTSVFGLVVRNA